MEEQRIIYGLARLEELEKCPLNISHVYQMKVHYKRFLF